MRTMCWCSWIALLDQIVEEVVGWFSYCIGTLDQQGKMFHHVFSRNEERRVIDPRVSRSSTAYKIFWTSKVWHIFHLDFHKVSLKFLNSIKKLNVLNKYLHLFYEKFQFDEWNQIVIWVKQNCSSICSKTRRISFPRYKKKIEVNISCLPQDWDSFISRHILKRMQKINCLYYYTGDLSKRSGQLGTPKYAKDE